MQHPLSRKILAPVVLLGLFLTGCGGGSSDPEPTPVAATLTVTSATSAMFNGVYTTPSVSLAEVVKVNPIGSEPEVCSFKFSGPRSPSGQMMTGDIRYIPGNHSLHVVFIAIDGVEFSSRDATNAVVDTSNSKVDFNGKVLPASTAVASTITVAGSVPMRGNRPEGC
jgi:hypothetical protein